MIDDNFWPIMFGFIFGMLLTALLASTYHEDNGKQAFIQRCQSDNGVAIFADKEYCIKRSAFVETVR